MYLMYYLNEDGKRVYTLKVRRDYYYRAFVCLFLSFFRRSLGETRGVVCCDLSLSRARCWTRRRLCCWLFFWSRIL